MRHIFRIIRGVTRTNVVYCWFASVYASIATITASVLGKPSFIVVGGVDVAKEEELGYGLWISPWKSFLSRMAIKRAHRVLVVDESLREEVASRVRYAGTNIEVLPTGFDSQFWTPLGTKETSVLTVAAVTTEGRFKIKGLDILFDVARSLPDLRFTVVGVDQVLSTMFVPPGNVFVVPAVSQIDLLRYYQRAKVYCQPSRREGLSNTLCEAMLCGCIPVATDVGGSTRAIGENGIVVRTGDLSGLASGIRRALGMPDRVGDAARERIASLFPKQRREERLKELLNELGR